MSIRSIRDLAPNIEFLAQYDPELAELMNGELKRQRRNIELIASENITSSAVMAAMGTVLTNKYAEGLPGKRFYGGCQNVDEVENLAIERAKKLFGCEFVNVQPHSGAQANLAVYAAFLQPGSCRGWHRRAAGKRHKLPGLPVRRCEAVR